MNFKANKTPFLIDSGATLDTASFVVLPVPYERTTSYRQGTKNGPAAILKAPWQLEPIR